MSSDFSPKVKSECSNEDNDFEMLDQEERQQPASEQNNDERETILMPAHCTLTAQKQVAASECVSRAMTPVIGSFSLADPSEINLQASPCKPGLFDHAKVLRKQ